MPISRREFEKISSKPVTMRGKVIEFLENNKNNAYTVSEIAKQLDMQVSIVAPYLNSFKNEGRVIHKGNFWIFNKNFKEKKIPSRKVKGDKKMWEKILSRIEENNIFHNLAGRGQSFKVVKATEDYIKVIFLDRGTPLKLEKIRFFSALNILKENKGKWVDIGASANSPKINTIEWRIKSDFDGKMNGLRTSTYVVAILVNVFDNIIFNGKAKGQALMMK